MGTIFVLKRHISICLLLFILCPSVNAQLSIQIDSIELQSISDFSKEDTADGAFDEGVSSILAYGPHISVCGLLVNSSPDTLIYYMSSGNHNVIDTELKTVFRYKNMTYETECCLTEVEDVFMPIRGNNYCELLSFEIKGKDVCMSIIPGNTSVPVKFGSAFLYGSPWCRLKWPEYLYKRHNIKNNEKLERIAKKVLPTLKANINIIINDSEQYQLLVRSIREHR